LKGRLSNANMKSSMICCGTLTARNGCKFYSVLIMALLILAFVGGMIKSDRRLYTALGMLVYSLFP